MDVTDMVQYNIETINRHNLEQSFFHLSRDDPTYGFIFDASSIAGPSYPKDHKDAFNADGTVDELTLRLRLGSHLAMHIRHQLEQQKGYTSTVGIATSKLLSKLVGNLNKPKGQTILMPPLAAYENGISNVNTFMDDHEIGKVPGIGFKLAQKLRECVLQRPAGFEAGLVYGGTKESVTVANVRNHAEINPEKLEKLLAGPGLPHGIGYKIWCLLHGVDDTEVNQAKVVPSQISIEDSYIRLDTMPELLKELNVLAKSLISRMRIDLLGEDDNFDEHKDDAERVAIGQITQPATSKKWLAHPKTLRLTTRPRQPLQPDGTRQRSFKRISHSAPLPNFVFSLSDSVDVLVEKLVHGTLVTMFRKLHPEKSGWNLSLVNLAVTNMAETAGDSKTANGRNIGSMFRRQDDVLRDFRVTDISPLHDIGTAVKESGAKDGWDRGVLDSPGTRVGNDGDEMDGWDDDGGANEDDERCEHCGLRMPSFAMIAHRRFHTPS